MSRGYSVRPGCARTTHSSLPPFIVSLHLFCPPKCRKPMTNPSSKCLINTVVDGPPRTTPCATCSCICRLPSSSSSLPSLSTSTPRILLRIIDTPGRSSVSSNCHPFFTQVGYDSDKYYGFASLTGVVRQEMLHLGLAGNILTSIGGNPILYGETYTPSFPVSIFFEDKLMLHLWAATKENIKSFMDVSPFVLFIHFLGPSLITLNLLDETA
jgi:hypothetical protein